MTIHFICRGNAFRSIIAEAYLNSLQLSNVNVLSSGTVASEHKQENAVHFQNTLALLKKHGIAQYAKDHHADDISQERVDQSDLVICLNKIAYDEALNLCELPANTDVWSVIDLGEEGRIATTDAEHEAMLEDVFDEITGSVDRMLEANLLAKKS